MEAPSLGGMEPSLAAPLRYSNVAVLLHWTMAFAIVANVVLAWSRDAVANPEHFPVKYHEGIGISIFFLAIVRLVWRLNNPPPLPFNGRGWEKKLRKLVHRSLYGVMIGMPVSGFLMVATSPGSAEGALFSNNLFALTQVLDSQAMKSAHLIFVIAHWAFSNVLYALVFLHLVGALRCEVRGQSKFRWMWFHRGGRV